MYMCCFVIVKKAYLIAKLEDDNRICSDNKNFDKRCNELESWLLEKGHTEKMVRKQVLRLVNILEKVYSKR